MVFLPYESWCDLSVSSSVEILSNTRDILQEKEIKLKNISNTKCKNNNLLNGFSPVCIFIWFASVLNWRNCKKHRKEEKRFENINKCVTSSSTKHEVKKYLPSNLISFYLCLTCFSQTLHWNGFSVLGNFIVRLSALDMRDLLAIFLIFPTVDRELMHRPAC